MRIERFEDIEALRLARELAHRVYVLTRKAKFIHDFGLKGQTQDVAGSFKEFNRFRGSGFTSNLKLSTVRRSNSADRQIVLGHFLQESGRRQKSYPDNPVHPV